MCAAEERISIAHKDDEEDDDDDDDKLCASICMRVRAGEKVSNWVVINQMEARSFRSQGCSLLWRKEKRRQEILETLQKGHFNDKLLSSSIEQPPDERK